MSRIPRKIRVDLATPPEVALRAAMAAVEAMPPDVRLTNAGTHISAALDLVSDYVDEEMCAVSIDPGPPKMPVPDHDHLSVAGRILYLLSGLSLDEAIDVLAIVCRCATDRSIQGRFWHAKDSK